ncbi:MAG TPA: hypothetical protein VLA58_05250 [Chitinophagaceae bacterium]|nr:hypothetical protein [Chitinophagaceae bacterium]
MRKLLAGIALLTLLAATSYADPGPEVKVSKFIQSQLMAAFPDAENVTWEKVGEYYMARFNNSLGSIMAYLDEDGGVYKVSRYIDCKSLPLTIQRSLNERFDLKDKDSKVLEVTRNNSQTYYLISFEYQNRKYIVESDLTGNLSVIKKEKL